MEKTERKPAVLLLEDGTVFSGYAAGKIGIATGEICFNTGMTGYQEVFTDPSYYGQIIVMTNVHIGNYGTKAAENESDSIKIAGMVCRNFNESYSRQQADKSIQAYLSDEDTVAISGVDTRAVVRHIRDKGAMNCIISSEISDIKELKNILTKVPSMAGLELSSKVTTKEPYEYGEGSGKFKVAVLDFGVKRNILKCLSERGCKLKVFPAKTEIDEMEAWKPDGYFLSNGPGDPSAMEYAIETTRQILSTNKPLFGICLGHQILSLAMGLKTYKMHNGHRGINHPVKNLMAETSEITSQNHGFGVSLEGIDQNPDIQVTHINLNDNSLEGIRLQNHPAFSVQFHPEASAGPHDSRYLFDDFIKLIKGEKAFTKSRVELQQVF